MSAALEIGLNLSTAANGRLHTEYVNDVPHRQRQRQYDTIAHLDYLMEDIVPLQVVPNLEKLDARWHPSGFMVFSLGDAPDHLGSQRLHIWPKGLRQRENRGFGHMENGDWDGDIHNHAWEVTSYNIHGYRDVLYDVHEESAELTPQEVATKGLFYRFRPWYKTDGTDALVNTGSCVSASLSESRQDILSSDIHLIDPWIYHAPTIPDDELGATLVVNSHRVFDPDIDPLEEWSSDEPVGLPDILIRGTTEPIVGARRIATLGEKILAKAQLLEILSKPPYEFQVALEGILTATYKQLADGQMLITA